MRALAVLLVFANHLLGWPTGGFIGVDVFFVLSGFLITGVLLRQHERTGRISLGDFYRRRFRRILPAALVVIAVTTAASWLVFSGGRALSITLDAAWAALFSANWRLAIVGTDYLQATGPESPLQHYWSLSVEEQFYFVWPLALIAAFLIARRRPNRAAAVVILVIGLLSFAWANIETAVTPTWAYFSTFSRVWELAAGALLAFGIRRFSTVPDRLRPILAWSGIAVIGLGALLIDVTAAFPGPLAIIPVLGTCAVIIAGTGSQSPRYLWPLTNRVAGYVGDISYSFYLWHFPVIVFSTSLLPGSPWLVVLVSIALTAVLSVLSYRFVEQPIRNSAWLEPRRRARLLWPAVGAVLTAVLLSFAIAAPLIRVAPVAVAAPIVDRDAALAEALGATAWPADLTPALDDVAASAPQQIQSSHGCLNPTTADSSTGCAYGAIGSSHVALVLGDSIAMAWMPGIVAAIGDDYEVRGIGFGNCPFAAVDIELPAAPADAERCTVAHSEYESIVAAIHPDILIISDLELGLERAVLADPADAPREWERAFAASLAAVSGSADKIVVLSSPPVAPATDVCATAGTGPKSCEGTIRRGWQIKSAAEKAAADAADVRYVDTSQWFCVGDRCPAFASSTLIRMDGMHLTTQYSESLAPQILEVLR